VSVSDLDGSKTSRKIACEQKHHASCFTSHLNTIHRDDMKSLFSRLRGNATPPPSRSSSSTSGDKENSNGPSTVHRKRPTSLMKTPSDTPVTTPLRSPTPLTKDDAFGSTRPRSEQDYTRDFASLDEARDPEDNRLRTFSASGEGGKKVTFRSPIPTVVSSTRPQGEISEHTRAASPERMNETQSRPAAPSRSSTAQSYSSKRSLSTRKSSVPYGQRFSGSPTKSPMLSPTESDGSQSTRSYLPPPNSWSEMAEEELIANLGPKERTRQEVLWEIVSSEER
jgi:hypothetical protein